MKPNQTFKSYISDGSANKAAAKWFADQPPRKQNCATPSSLMACPRTIWLRYAKGLQPTNEMGWGKKQRNEAGRMYEALIAKQYHHSKQLLWHWADGAEDISEPFTMGEGPTLLRGTPDLLLDIEGIVYISDAKTARGDGFAYVPLTASEAFKDPLWNRNRVQLNAYFMLAQANRKWFEKHDLPLPTACHLFSYALDDGVVRREFTWTPSTADFAEVRALTLRWNIAYASKTMPDCNCSETDTKFCPMATEFTLTRSGYKLGSVCCHENLLKLTEVTNVPTN